MQSNQTNNSTGRSYSLLKRGFCIMCSLFILSFFIPQSAVMAQTAARLNNKGVEYDKAGNYKEANKYYKEAAKKGDANACSNLGYNYEYGCGIEKDEKKAFEYYKRGSELGGKISNYRLGTCYYFGTGTSVDYAKAAEYWQKASDADYAGGAAYLAFCYYHGNGRTQDYAKALELWEKSFKIDSNFWPEYGEPEFLTGECYFNGQGTDVDIQLAKSYYEKASKKGWQAATDKLNSTNWDEAYAAASDKFLQKAKNDIANKDYESALKTLTYVYQKYNYNKEACKYLGYLYYNGKGVKQDQKEGLDYYDRCNDDESALIVGLAYLYGGRGYIRSLNLALKTLDREGNNPDIKYYYAETKYEIALENGDINALTDIKALYTKAAACGSADAKKKLAQWATVKAPIVAKANANEQAAKKAAAEKEAAKQKRRAAFAKLEEGDRIVYCTEESGTAGVWIFKHDTYRNTYVKCMVMSKKDQGAKFLVKITEISVNTNEDGYETPRIDGYKVREGDEIWVKNPANDSHWQIWN